MIKNQNPLLISKALALSELFFTKIEILIRESNSDEIFKAHCLFRLKECQLITQECIKGIDADFDKEPIIIDKI